MQLVQDDAAQAREIVGGVLVGQQQRQGSGVVSSMSGGWVRCRARRFCGVSPVRVSIRTVSPISSTGRVRLRPMSVVSALSGET